MPLKHLDCGYTPVFDLSPLKDMHLTSLCIGATKVSDHVTPARFTSDGADLLRHAGL